MATERGPAFAASACKVQPNYIGCTDEARAMLDDFERRIKDALEQGEARRNPFLSRALEHAIKLSLVIAVGDRPDTTVIEPAHMRWAIDMAWVSTCSMIGEAESKIADNDRQRVYNLIYDHIRKAGPEGGQPNRLRGRLSGAVWKSNWKEIVEELRETGRVQLRKTKPSDGGRPSERYIASEFVHANDNNRAGGKVVQGGS